MKVPDPVPSEPSQPPESPGPLQPLERVAVALALDCADLRCPLPVIELARRLDEVPVGAVIAVGTRDVAARTDVPAWCRMRGQDYLGERTDQDGVPQHLVRRRD